MKTTMSWALRRTETLLTAWAVLIPITKYIPSSYTTHSRSSSAYWIEESREEQMVESLRERLVLQMHVRSHETWRANIFTAFYSKSVFYTIIWMLQHKCTPPSTLILNINRKIKHCINLFYNSFADLLMSYRTKILQEGT